jgi:hypothetical protein
MHDEDENVVGDEFEMDENADMDAPGFEPEEEDSYDPDDRFH